MPDVVCVESEQDIADHMIYFHKGKKNAAAFAFEHAMSYEREDERREFWLGIQKLIFNSGEYDGTR